MRTNSQISTGIPINTKKEDFACQLIADGYLSLDEEGRLHKNIDRNTNNAKYIDKVIDREDKNGYMQISLNIGGKKRLRIRIHRIIWIYYNGEIPEGKQINHKDGNKKNNNIKNLELATGKENIQHALNILKTIKKNWESHKSKYTKEEYIEIKALIGKKTSYKKIIKMMNMPQSTYYRIKKAIKKGIEGL